jgi:phage baseplate assembly protein W
MPPTNYQAPTTTPINYGTTISCTSDLDVSGLLISGLRTLAEALVRRLGCPPGRLLDDPDYGFDITSLVNEDLNPPELNDISGGIDQEFLKDERVQLSVTSAAFVAGALTTTSQVTTANGPFSLVLSVTSVTVAILSLQGPLT